MGTPSLISAQQAELSARVAQYILAQRDKYLSCSQPLSPEQKARMGGFFRPALLEATRALTLIGEHISNPEFYPMLEGLGFKNLPDVQEMAATTFNDIVVSHGPLSDGVLFHELVHVEQYRQLGVLQFATLYVRGFLTGGSYEAIPLEINAYTSGEAFENHPDQHFSVESHVAAWIRENRF